MRSDDFRLGVIFVAGSPTYGRSRPKPDLADVQRTVGLLRVVQGATSQAAAYTYFRRDENEAQQANVLTHDDARRIAANIAKLPELLSRPLGPC